MNREGKKRLRMLEEAAAKRQEEETPPGTMWYGRLVPYDYHKVSAADIGWEAYCERMRPYGWSEADLIEDKEWWMMVAQRVEDAGLDWLAEMCDQINFMHVCGRDERYPGPGFWFAGDAELPHPTPEIMAQREAEFEARQRAKRGGGGSLS